MTEHTVLVTGGSGLLGRAVCHRLGTSGFQVIALDKEGPPYPPPNTDCIFVDLTSDESVQTSFHILEERHGTQLDAVIHLAAYYSFAHKESSLYDKVTVSGTRRILRELNRISVGQFIFSSTMLVHKPTLPGMKISENSPLEGTWGYPRSKIETEKAIAKERGDIPATILRIAGVYTNLCQSIPIAHQIERIYERQPTSHFYPGSLETRQAYVHLEDLIDCLVASINNRAKRSPFSTYLIGEDEAMSYEELQTAIAEHLYGLKWSTYQIPAWLAKLGAHVQQILPGDRFIKPWMVDHSNDNYELDISAARSDLGWSPRHRLSKVLPVMLEGLSEDPVRWYEINKLPKSSALKGKPPHHRLREAH